MSLGPWEPGVSVMCGVGLALGRHTTWVMSRLVGIIGVHGFGCLFRLFTLALGSRIGACLCLV